MTPRERGQGCRGHAFQRGTGSTFPGKKAEIRRERVTFAGFKMIGRRTFCLWVQRRAGPLSAIFEASGDTDTREGGDAAIAPLGFN